MKFKIAISSLIFVAYTVAALGLSIALSMNTDICEEPIPMEVEYVEGFVNRIDIPKEPKEKEVIEVITVTVPKEEPLPDNDILLIAKITMAEAENESEYGQRLVIDSILNRVDHYAFPNTIEGVIYQKNQFSCVSNGRADKCYAKKELIDLVESELSNRTNEDVIFFRAKEYSIYGTPLFQEGGHCFSSY